jgi:hypothetical protein
MIQSKRKFYIINGVAALTAICFVFLFIFAFFHKANISRNIASGNKKIVILYSDIGSGHISASKVIRNNILKENSQAKVVMKNIRDFIPSKALEWIDRKAFYLLFENAPNLFDTIYKNTMAEGNRIPDLADKGSSYNEEMLLEYLIKENPSSIIATHYGSAEVLGNLRAKGHLSNTRIGWIHTDYMEAYFPRISERIDDSFLAHDDLTQKWIESGVPSNKVHTTGMPLNDIIFGNIETNEFMKAQNLDPKVKTICIATGADGSGNYIDIVKNIIKDNPGAIQIVTILAKNEKEKLRLEKWILSVNLPNNVKILTKGFIPQEELLSFIKSSDIYITKGGGLSPTEGIALKKPLILMEITKAHEAENLLFFEKNELSLVNRDLNKLGLDVNRLMSDEGLQTNMLKAQLAFINMMDTRRITQFALSNQNYKEIKKFGVNNTVEGVISKEALSALEHDVPADIEILLSDAMMKTKKYSIEEGENPFGHIALRIDNVVYTLNWANNPDGTYTPFFKTDLDTYLYGTRKNEGIYEIAGQYGQTHARNVYSLRVNGISSKQKLQMLKEIKKIEHDATLGLTYNYLNNNCSHILDRTLKAADIRIYGENTLNSKYQLPMETFERAITYFENLSDTTTDLVAFAKTQDPKSEYKFALTPLNPFRPLRSAKNYVLKNERPYFYDRISKFVISPSSGKNRAIYRNIEKYLPDKKPVDLSPSKIDITIGNCKNLINNFIDK